MGLMGPRSGTNNPVSSGAYFGVAGRIIGSLLEATASLAFAALSIWTGGDALAGALVRFFGLGSTTLPRLAAYAVLSVIITVLSVLGHANMVAVQRVMIPTAGLIMIIGIGVYGVHFDPSYAGTGAYVFGSATATWAASALIVASSIASYGAYAGDWTRHISTKLHTDRSITRAMFFGALFGLGGPFMWGTFTAASVISAGHASAATPYVIGLVDGAPLWFVPALVYLGLASGTAQAVINTYGTGLDTSSIIPRLSRPQATLVACGVATALVYVGHADEAVINWVGIFLQLLTCFSAPWIIIVAIGHFRRRGYYDVDALQVFNRGQRGGVYWFRHGINPRGMAVWAASAASGLLFSDTTWYAGPGARLLGGVDVSFVVAGAAAAVLYPAVLALFPEPAGVYGPRPAVDHIDSAA